MGNAPSRDGFAGVLPSASAGKVSGEVSCVSKSAVSGSVAASPSVSSSPDEAALSLKPKDGVPLSIGKLKPPGHALQLKEPLCSGSRGAGVPVDVEQGEPRFLASESVRKSRTLAAYADVCSEILPSFLYVSNLRVARDAAKLRDLGITHVINCCGELRGEEECDGEAGQIAEALELPEVLELRLLLRDDANEDFTPFLPEIMLFIAGCRRDKPTPAVHKGAKVLVHCHQGISRSCALAIAYIMLEQRVSFHEAAALVKCQRAISSPNAAFICQLIEWEKELQALTTEADRASSTLLRRLYRLTPHAKHDAGCLVLKRCFEPGRAAVKQRQGVVSMQEPDPERRWLWSHGTFVFQSPTNPHQVKIWHGSQCKIPRAIMVAREQVEKLLQLETLARVFGGAEPLAMQIVEVQASSTDHADPDVDHFSYTEELQWITEQSTRSSNLGANEEPKAASILSGDERNRAPKEKDEELPTPQLYVLETLRDAVEGADTWDQLTNYDSEDLTSDAAFLLCSLRTHGLAQGFVWLGADCTFPPEKVVVAAQAQVGLLLRVKGSPCEGEGPSSVAIKVLAVERQNQESDAFWQLFEAGY